MIVLSRDEQGGYRQNTPLSFENGAIPPLDFSPKVRQKGPKFLQNGGAILFLIQLNLTVFPLDLVKLRLN